MGDFVMAVDGCDIKPRRLKGRIYYMKNVGSFLKAKIIYHAKSTNHDISEINTNK